MPVRLVGRRLARNRTLAAHAPARDPDWSHIWVLGLMLLLLLLLILLGLFWLVALVLSSLGV
jgi:hypothetical protein